MDRHAVEIRPGADLNPVYTKAWGPYDDNRLLIADLLKQCPNKESELAEYDTAAIYKANALKRAWKAVLGWPEQIASGAKAAKEIDGIGKSTAGKIDEILKNVGVLGGVEREEFRDPLFTLLFTHRNPFRTETSSIIPTEPWTLSELALFLLHLLLNSTKLISLFLGFSSFQANS